MTVNKICSFSGSSNSSARQKAIGNSSSSTTYTLELNRKMEAPSLYGLRTIPIGSPLLWRDTLTKSSLSSLGMSTQLMSGTTKGQLSSITHLKSNNSTVIDSKLRLNIRYQSTITILLSIQE
jgi:hypothetical protein